MIENELYPYKKTNFYSFFKIYAASLQFSWKNVST